MKYWTDRGETNKSDCLERAGSGWGAEWGETSQRMPFNLVLFSDPYEGVIYSKNTNDEK